MHYGEVSVERTEKEDTRNVVRDVLERRVTAVISDSETTIALNYTWRTRSVSVALREAAELTTDLRFDVSETDQWPAYIALGSHSNNNYLLCEVNSTLSHFQYCHLIGDLLERRFTACNPRSARCMLFIRLLRLSIFSIWGGWNYCIIHPSSHPFMTQSPICDVLLFRRILAQREVTKLHIGKARKTMLRLTPPRRVP